MTIHIDNSNTELSAAERHKILVEWNNTQADYPKEKCIHQLFEVQVEWTPNAIAVVFEDQQLTYHELNRRANQLAHHLQSLGVSPEVLVGICVERSLEMVVGLLAILKAGGAYVPLDPTYPKERLAFMLADAQVPILLTQKKLVEELPEHQAQIVYLETSKENLPDENPVSQVTLENLVYVIYTSGSTGRPKGVLIPHQGLLNLVFWHQQAFEVTHKDKSTQLAKMAFDASTWELWPYLSAGTKIYLIEDEIIKSPAALQNWLIETQITVSFIPTPLAEALLRLEWPENLALRIMLTGGDQLHHFPPRSLSFKLVNNYGPTENTVVTTSGLVIKNSENRLPHIGCPIANTQVYLLDEHQMPVSIGVPGELHIGGASLARGYLNRPDLTAEKFIPNPFSKVPGSRCYKTGDLARFFPDGHIEFLGRIDNQVKIRGFRIELGEIEMVLVQHPTVQQAVVMVWEVKAGDKRLVAYIIPRYKSAPNPSELHYFLKKQLPDYMVPATFVTLEKLPLTPNGKIDRKALPTPDPFERIIDRQWIAPRTPIEELLTTIWIDILDSESIGIYDNFFALGGHSLLITQVISRVRETLGVELPISSLFDYPTIAELAQHIEMLLRQKPHLQQTPAIQPISRLLNLPLSYFQEQLWFLAQLNPNVPFYNESVTIHINTTLDVAVLEQSLNEIIRRHEALRTTFATVDGQAVQKIRPPLTFNLPVVDLSVLPLAQREVKAQQLATEQTTQLFDLTQDILDLTQDILLRATLVRLGKTQYRLFLTLHHLIIDGVSLAIFMKELALLYQAFSTTRPSPLPELPIQYVDFADWQRQQLSIEKLETLMSYWKTQLGDLLPMLQLPTDYPRPINPTFRGAKQYLTLSKSLTEALKKLSQQAGVTLFMTLLAAFNTLLHRYTGQDDIAVGTVAAIRNRPELENMIGYFLNTLVLRTQLKGTPTFQQLLARVREVTREAMAHNELPFVTLVETLHTERHLGQNPLFQVAFTLDPSMPEIDLGWTLTQSDIDNGTAKFDLYLGLEEKPTGISGRIEYNTDLFDAPTIERMIGHFQTLLEGIVANPGQRISELPLLTERERHQLLVQWNDTQTDYPKEKCIHHLFEEQVEKTPDAVAVIFEEQQLTYRELNIKANQLAHYLQIQAVKPEILVGICLERSCEMVIGLLGILKAGGAYLPLDPAYPIERLAFMLEDAQVPVLLTQSGLIKELPKTIAQVVYLDIETKTLSLLSIDNLITEITPTNLAYVIYTSGSTGKPKGVMVPHHAINRLVFNTNYVQLRTSDKVVQASNVSFDAATFEIWSALLHGAQLIGITKNTALSPQKLLTCLREQQITILFLTTALFNQLAKEIPFIFNQIRYILFGSEAVEPRWVTEILKHGRPQRLLHVYGPTENTTFSSWYLVENVSKGAVTIPIGRPIANTEIYILDQYLQPVPIGTPGELYIGGAGLARGYLNRPELTAEKFISNPFSDAPNSRLYKTGDLARYDPDGNIEFLDRIDNQVKIRGFRIELGEIETVLAQHPGVREVAVIVREDQPDNKRLVAYIVPNSTPNPTASTLRNSLKEKLPDYMIPSAFIMLETMPLTPNGKLDRRALAQLLVTSYQLSKHTIVAPRDALELQLTKIWENILEVCPIGVQDNFFELGGHSLLAIRLMAEIQQQFEQNLPLATLFQGATIEQLAKIIRQQTDFQSGSPLVAIQPHGAKRPFFCMPGSGGNVIYFHQLARYLGQERPFYALQAKGIDGKSAPLTRVEDMATYYLEAIRTVQPQGPYLLGGHSFGALVAFEMAQQLHRKGQNVALLAILDLPALHPDRQPTELDWDEAKWMATIAHILESLSGKNLALCYEDFQPLDAEAQLTLLSARLESVNLLPPEAGINYVRCIVQVIKADELAYLRYVPPTGYPNRITLFKTSDIYQDELGMLDEKIPSDPAWGWGHLSTEPVEIHVVPGNHTLMLTEPHVQVLADKLKYCFEYLNRF